MADSGAHFNNFSWPSLYSPAKEVGFLGPPVRLGGYYLSEPEEVFVFTLYWTLVFHLPFSIIAGVYAFFNLLFPPAVIPHIPGVPGIVRQRSSRLTFALLVFLVFLVLSVLSAVAGAAVLACVLVGVYRAGGFYMSTWIPFVWAVIQSLISLLGVWPSVVDII